MAKSRFEEATSAAKAQVVGVLDRSNRIFDELNRADTLTDNILGILLGEGSLDSVLHDSSTLAEMVTNKLQRIVEALDPNYNKPRQVGKGQ